MRIIPRIRIVILWVFIAHIPHSTLFAGRILLSHLDADYHASFDCGAACLNPEGAQSFIRTAVAWVQNGSTKPFLFVESGIIPPYADLLPNSTLIDGSKAFHVDGEKGILNSGFVAGVDYQRHDASTLATALANLSNYSAIVVASDFGGILTAAELAILNSSRNAIANFLNSGGGVFAMAESNDGIGHYDPKTGRGLDESFTDSTRTTLKCCNGLLGAEQRYGFLPFPVTVESTFGILDKDTVITAIGASIGLTAGMLEGNTSQLYFGASPDYQVATADRFGRAANVVAEYSFISEPGTGMTTALALIVTLAFSARRYRKSHFGQTRRTAQAYGIRAR